MGPPQGRAEGEENLPDLLPTLLVMHPRVGAVTAGDLNLPRSCSPGHKPRVPWGAEGPAWHAVPVQRSAPGSNSLLVPSQDMLTMLGDQGPNYNNEEFPELNIFPSFSE